MQNVDFKCELRDAALARAIVRRLNAIHVGESTHHDTYYRVPDGRLKRRRAEGEPVEWIVYHRSDRPTPAISRFSIYSEEQLRERYGERDLPEWLSFTKRRDIWLLEGVRIHFDNVDHIGAFLEVDALVSTSRNVAACHAAIARIRTALEPALGGMIATSYADLVALERQLGDEGDIDEPEWFVNWAPPETVIERIDLRPPDDEPPRDADHNAA
jgi:adenylate cyclase class IV